MRLLWDIRFGTERYPEKVARRLRTHNMGTWLAAAGSDGVVVLETWHEFSPGLVARTIFIPAGTVLTGATHREGCMAICFGDIEVGSPGCPLVRLTGYNVLSSAAGIKRIGRTFADTWFTTVHLNPGNETDIDKLEDALVVESARLQRRRL